MFMDVFSPLFDKLITQIPLNSISALTLYTVVRNKFTSLRDILLKLNYPNFNNETKLQLVIDEAQILGDRGNGLFVSSSGDDKPRPM